MSNKKLFYGWIVVFTLMGMFAMSSGSRYTFNVVFKTLTEEFHWGRSALSAVPSLSLILVSAFQIASGWLADRFGGRLTLTVGFVISGLVLFAMSFVTDLWQVYLIYGVFGAIGFALASPAVSSAMVSRWFAARSRGTALSLAMAGVAFGQLLITPIATYLMVSGGWRMSYQTLSVVMLIVMLPLVLLLLRNPPTETAEVRAEAHAADGGRTSLWDAMRHPTFWQLLMGVFACGFTMSFANVHFMAYASDMGVHEMVAANDLGMSGLFSIIGAVLMGRWSDRIGRRVPLGITYALRGLAFAILYFANNEITLFFFAVTLGLSWTSTTPLSAAVTAETWGRQSAGFLFGVIYTFMTVGSAIGSYLGGLDYDLLHNYTAIIIANVVVAGLGAIASFMIKEGRARNPAAAVARAEASPVAAGR
ncbi:MAG: MFS transporter [Chloroflexi bacterium]|nr:MFS transporter [Chloroflexota bacterium]